MPEVGLPNNENLDEISMWEIFPDSLMLEVFSFLSPKEILLISSVCQRWYKTSRDDLLWKKLFERTYEGDNCDPPDSFVSWFKEFQRVYSETPVVETQVLTEHSDEVLHVAFSHNGAVLASSSKDCSAILWDIEEDQVKMREKFSFQKYRWEYVQLCEFNCDDTLLLVSGVNSDRQFNFRGEIFIYGISTSDNQPSSVLQTIANEPYDVFGAWLNDSYYISGRFEYVPPDFDTSVSELMANCVNDGERQFSLCRVLNRNSSSVRTVLVATPKSTSGTIQSDEEILIFTHGTCSYTPHQVILRKVSTSAGTDHKKPPDETEAKNEDQEEVRTIETSSHIIGMNLSPDHSFLYVNCRPWISGEVPVRPDAPPEISTDIHLRVYDLSSCSLVRTYRGHRASTPSDNCFFIFLDVAETIVASGAEDHMVHIWDRHYGGKLGSLAGHTNVVNSVSFNPKNPEMLVSASDDHTLRVWSSRRKASASKRKKLSASSAQLCP